MVEAYEVARRHLGVAAQRRKAAYDIRVQDVSGQNRYPG